jgi:hypothetical protein
MAASSSKRGGRREGEIRSMKTIAQSQYHGSFLKHKVQIGALISVYLLLKELPHAANDSH